MMGGMTAPIPEGAAGMPVGATGAAGAMTPVGGPKLASLMRDSSYRAEVSHNHGGAGNGLISGLELRINHRAKWSCESTTEPNQVKRGGLPGASTSTALPATLLPGSAQQALDYIPANGKSASAPIGSNGPMQSTVGPMGARVLPTPTGNSQKAQSARCITATNTAHVYNFHHIILISSEAARINLSLNISCNAPTLQLKISCSSYSVTSQKRVSADAPTLLPLWY